MLLCSLLLGFGLDAYVCVGTKSKGAVHAWVVTISVEGTIVFWESLNGHRYEDSESINTVELCSGELFSFLNVLLQCKGRCAKYIKIELQLCISM